MCINYISAIFIYLLDCSCNYPAFILPLILCLMNYNINKGIGRTVEFKGLKAQYLFIFAGGLLGTLRLLVQHLRQFLFGDGLPVGGRVQAALCVVALLLSGLALLVIRRGVQLSVGLIEVLLRRRAGSQPLVSPADGGGRGSDAPRPPVEHGLLWRAGGGRMHRRMAAVHR